GQLFFSADDGVAGAELWAYDDGASLAADISSGPGPSYPGGYFTVFDYAGGLVTYDGRLFFQAVPSSSPGLWFYDADAGEAELAADVSPPEYLTIYDGRLFFAASGSGSGNELWVY